MNITQRYLLPLVAVTALACSPALPQVAMAGDAPQHPVTNVLLVHGFWANGSSWSKVIPRLAGLGFHVTAVELPLTSLTDDAATLTRAIALEDGPVILVGHSYGGAVITEAGGDPKVAALVYVSAFAPDAGESAASLLATVPTAPVNMQITKDDFGNLKLTDKGVREDFAQDLREEEQLQLATTQGPTSVNCLGSTISIPAWRSKPSWYIVATHDRVIPPELEETMSKTIGAKTISVSSSHVVMLSNPDRVVAMIERAAGRTRADHN